MTTDPPGRATRLWLGLQRGRRQSRRWRRGRPFWGGLLLMLGGLQLFLSTQMSLLDVEISFGPEGFLVVVLPAVLLLCGSLAWITPQHRHFYSIIGTLTAVYSLLGLNLGGWFLGMLLGILGGALTFAWTPVAGDQPAAERDAHATGPLTDETPGRDQTAPVRAPRRNSRTYVAAALPLLLAAGFAAPPAASQLCLPPLIPCPPESPSPSPTPHPGPGEPAPAPEPTGGPGPGPLPTPTGPPDPSPTASPSPTPTLSPSPIPTIEPPEGQPLVAAQPALMTADRLEQQGFLFEGITELPTASGPIEVLQFSFRESTATNFVLEATADGETVRVAADPLTLAGDDETGNVTFYTSRFEGRLLGTAPLELDPDSPLVALLELVNVPLNVFFTDVDLDLVFTSGAELTATGFLLSLP